MAYWSGNGYLLRLMENVSKLDYLCDVTLVAGLDNAKFSVHRNILVAASPYFHALLGPKYKEATEDEVLLSGIDGKTLKAIIDYCYTGRIEITNDNVGDIMDAASSKELIHLEKLCSQFWSEHLDIKNCLNILMHAEKYNLTNLWQTSLRYIGKNLIKIPHNEMVKIDEKILGAILKHDQLTAAESLIFDRFMEWVQHDEPNRSAHVAALADLIRLEHLPGELLEKTVEPFYEKHGCLKLVLNEYRRYRNRSQDSREISLYRFASRMDRVCCATWARDAEGIKTYEFDEEKEIWSESKKIECDIFDVSGCVYANGKLLVFGETLDETIRHQLQMQSCDLKTGNKEWLPDLPHPISSICSSPVSIGKYIYVIGLSDIDEDEDTYGSCQRFDTEEKLWVARAPLPFSANNYIAIEMNGLIFVSGIVFNSLKLWCYAPEQNLWIEKAGIRARNEIDNVLFKVKGRICLCNHHIGFYTYDVNRDCWTKVKTRVRSWTTTLDVVGAIDFRENTYGFLASAAHQQFGIIETSDFITSRFIKLAGPRQSSFIEDCRTASRFQLFIH